MSSHSDYSLAQLVLAILAHECCCDAGLTKTVGLELAQKGNITCNAICPGYVLTDLIRNQLENTAKARGIPKVLEMHLLLAYIARTSCASYAHARGQVSITTSLISNAALLGF